MKEIFLLIYFFSVIQGANAQVGFGTTTPDPSAAVEIKDSAKGLLIPRMDLTHKNAIQNPATGLMIYQTDSIEGFWYFDGRGWKNINASSNYGGKHRIVLSDTITNIAAQAKIALEFGANTQEISIQGCSNLTSIDLSMFTSLTIISIIENPLLTSVNLSNLKSCEGCFTIFSCPVLNNLDVSSLEKIVGGSYCNGLVVQYSGLTTLNFPKLKWLLGNLFIDNNSVLTSISFPMAIEFNYVTVYYNSMLTSVSCPLLQKIGAINFNTNTALSTLSLPSLTHFYQSQNTSQIIQSPNLSSFVLGNLASFNNPSLSIYEAKLTSLNINNLLHSFVTIPGLTNKGIALYGMNPPAPPTGQGLIDKATLIANGNSVSTD